MIKNFIFFCQNQLFKSQSNFNGSKEMNISQEYSFKMDFLNFSKSLECGQEIKIPQILKKKRVTYEKSP